MPEQGALLEDGPVAGRGGGDPTVHETRLGSRGVAELLQRFGGIGVLVLIYAGFAIALPDTFPTSTTAKVLLSNEPVNIAIALAVLAPLVVGEFDLSVGYVLGFATVLLAWLTGTEHMAMAPAIAITLAFGLAIGAINGTLLVVFRINSFIATLGTGIILSGMILWRTGGNILSGTPQGLHTALASTWLEVIPSGLVYVLIVAALMWVVHERTRLGRIATATGLNPEAARLSGVPVNTLKFVSFVISGLLAACAGILDLAVVGSAYPTVGPQFLLPAFAASFLGASMIVPGFFNVRGLVIASLILAVGAVGLGQAGAPFWAESIFDGGVLIVAVAVSARRGRT